MWFILGDSLLFNGAAAIFRHCDVCLRRVATSGGPLLRLSRLASAERKCTREYKITPQVILYAGPDSFACLKMEGAPGPWAR